MILMTVPPAQAEALFDAQDEGRDDYLSELRRCDRTAGQPWRDDDGDEGRVLNDCRATGDSRNRSPLPAPSFGPAR